MIHWRDSYSEGVVYAKRSEDGGVTLVSILLVYSILFYLHYLTFLVVSVSVSAVVSFGSWDFGELGGRDEGRMDLIANPPNTESRNTRDTATSIRPSRPVVNPKTTNVQIVLSIFTFTGSRESRSTHTHVHHPPCGASCFELRYEREEVLGYWASNRSVQSDFNCYIQSIYRYFGLVISW